jgi:hypothetical protein
MVKKHVGRLVARPTCQDSAHAHEVPGSTPTGLQQNFTPITNDGVPRGDPWLGHVAPFHSPPT